MDGVIQQEGRVEMDTTTNTASRGNGRVLKARIWCT